MEPTSVHKRLYGAVVVTLFLFLAPFLITFPLFYALSGTVNSPMRQDEVHPVSRIMGDSVLLFLNITPGEKSHLDFQSLSGERHELAVVKNGKWVRNTSNDRFGQRLEMVNETLLRITDLEKEDSGLFKFGVRHHQDPAMIQGLTFNLTVYGKR